MEGWTELMMDLEVTVSDFVFIYSCVLVFIGAFIVVNLIMAVVAIKFF